MPQGTPPLPKPSNEPALIVGLIGLVCAVGLSAVALVVPGIPGDVIVGCSMLVFFIAGIIFVRAALQPRRTSVQIDAPEDDPPREDSDDQVGG